MSIYCTQPNLIRCRTHSNETSPVPCRKCENCISLRKMDLVNRFKEFQTRSKEDKSVEMWTFGTNWKYNDPGAYEYLKKCWVLFMKRVRNTVKYANSKYKFIPLFRAYEYGKSGYLHVHVITLREGHRLKIQYKYEQYNGVHKLLRKIWSDVTEINNPNVNYTYRPSWDPLSAFKYSSKYLNKSELKNAHYMHRPLWRTKNKKAYFTVTTILQIDSKRYDIETNIDFGCKFDFEFHKPDMMELLDIEKNKTKSQIDLTEYIKNIKLNYVNTDNLDIIDFLPLPDN